MFANLLRGIGVNVIPTKSVSAFALLFLYKLVRRIFGSGSNNNNAPSSVREALFAGGLIGAGRYGYLKWRGRI